MTSVDEKTIEGMHIYMEGRFKRKFPDEDIIDLCWKTVVKELNFHIDIAKKHCKKTIWYETKINDVLLEHKLKYLTSKDIKVFSGIKGNITPTLTRMNKCGNVIKRRRKGDSVYTYKILQ